MWGYDRLLVPVSRQLQRVLRRPPLGKNVILVARKRNLSGRGAAPRHRRRPP